MKRKLQSSLLSFFILLLVGHAWAEVDLTKLVKKVQPAVVTIITYDKSNKGLGQGSGFFINNKGHLITNYHVLKGAYRSEVKTYDGKRYRIKWVVAEDKAMDLIKVLVDIPAESVQWISVSRATPAIAERILVVGSPMGLEQTVSEGIISAIREVPNLGAIYQISAPISSGSSGSPVVNMNAEVIGVATIYSLEGQNLNFAVPGKRILDLVKKKSKKVRLFVDTEEEKSNAEAYFGLGVVYSDLGRYTEAIEVYKQAIRINPDYADAHCNLGVVFFIIGKKNAALGEYNILKELDKDMANELFNYIYK